jgi:hypothetical protein
MRRPGVACDHFGPPECSRCNEHAFSRAPETPIRGRVRISARRAGVFAVISAALCIALCGCRHGATLKLIRSQPYPIVRQEDSTVRYLTPDDSAVIEVKTAAVDKPVENLAVHYTALFPDGEPIRPGDIEEYVTVAGKKAYKVSFSPSYIRKRKRMTELEEGDVPAGWRTATMEDPGTGESIAIVYGPIIPRRKVLYLVEGGNNVYYVFMRADGPDIEAARTKFEEFVNTQINYL